MVRALNEQSPPSAAGEHGASNKVASWIESLENLGSILDGGAASLPRQVGRFVILRELGRGGHGFVLLAHDPILRRHVALKLPRPEHLLSPVLRRRFLRESQAAARLTHPNLVSVYEVGQAGPFCYIASAYCAGPTLSEWLSKRSTPVPPRIAARIVNQLASAMQYAHAHGVLHRDLKPSNVLLEPRRQDEATAIVPHQTDELDFDAKVADFGSAKLAEESDGTVTRSGCAVGTPAYIAPEQAKGNVANVGPLADVYALGAILYEVLAAKPLFRGASDLETLHKVLVEDPAPLPHGREIPTDIEAICLKCLEKKPEDRYQSCAALAEDLQHFLDSMPTSARPLSRVQHVFRWAGRNRTLAALSSAVVVLLLSITIVATVAAFRISNSRDEAERIAALERDAREELRLALVAEQKSHGIARAAERQAEARGQSPKEKPPLPRRFRNSWAICLRPPTRSAREGSAFDKGMR